MLSATAGFRYPPEMSAVQNTMTMIARPKANATAPNDALEVAAAAHPVKTNRNVPMNSAAAFLTFGTQDSQRLRETQELRKDPYQLYGLATAVWLWPPF